MSGHRVARGFGVAGFDCVEYCDVFLVRAVLPVCDEVQGFGLVGQGFTNSTCPIPVRSEGSLRADG